MSDTDFIALLSLVILLQLRIGGVNTITGAFLGAMFFAFFGVLTNHDATATLSGHDIHLGELQYLLTGLGAIAISRDPAGIGGHIANAAEALRERIAEWRDRPRTGVHPSETARPDQELARV